MSIKSLRGIRSLVDRYDTYVVDLWGTLHDGFEPYPGAVDALERLKGAGKRIALLSNVPRHLDKATDLIERIGIGRDLYDVMMTSGESVFRSLRDRADPWHAKLSGICWHLGPQRDRHIFQGLDIELQAEPEGAGFCVATGAALAYERVEDYRDLLDRGLALNLPMVCANPDIMVPVGNALGICAGAFAQYYEGKGGDVFWHGKPYRAIYETLFAELAAATGRHLDPERTLGLGDGLHTDVAGAAKMGIKSALLTGGLHKDDLALNWRGKPRGKALDALLDSAVAKPDHVLRRFAW
jgi:HAD superfamily hydrolase (TIGR01459 family)